MRGQALRTALSPLMSNKTKRASSDVGKAAGKAVKKGKEAESASETTTDRDSPTAFSKGTPVIIQSGSNAGKRGKTLGYDREDGMYEIELHVGGGLVFLDRKSLLPRYDVFLLELQDRPDLNMKEGTIEAWDEKDQRYEVLVAGSRVKLPMTNIMLPAGARCCVHGLTSAAQHNGTLGRVVGFDEDESGRYDIEYADKAGALACLRVERANVRL